MSARAMRRVLSLSVAVVLVVGAVPFSAAATQPVPVPVPESGPASVEQHGDVIVRFGPSVSASSVAASAHERAGADSVRTLDQVPGLQSVTLESGITVEEAIAAYEAMPGVLYAEPNDIDIQFVAVPNDTRFSDQWHLDNTGQTGGTPDADMDVPEAWSFTTGSGGVVVAVLDNGVDYEHPDLADNMWRNPGEIPGNDVDDDANGWVDDIYGVDTGRGRSDPAPGYSDGPHGTRCASIVGAQGGNALGISGVSQNLSIMALKTTDVFGDPDVESMVEAIEYADDMGAHIISCSWGAWTESQAITDAIAASDALFVFAAGNEGEDVDVFPFYPAATDLPNILSVGASDHSDQLAGSATWDTSYGATTVDVFAPGEDILVADAVDPAWYPMVPPTVLFEEDFDSPTLDASPIWDRSEYVHVQWRSDANGHEGTDAAYVSRPGDELFGERSVIRCSQRIDLSGAKSPWLIWWEMKESGWYDEDGFVFGFHDASENKDYIAEVSQGGYAEYWSDQRVDISDLAGPGRDDLYLFVIAQSDPGQGDLAYPDYTSGWIDDIQIIDVEYDYPVMTDLFSSASKWDAQAYTTTPWRWRSANGGEWYMENYTYNEDSWLRIAQPIDCSEGLPVIRYRELRDTAAGGEGLRMLASNNGMTWTDVSGWEDPVEMPDGSYVQEGKLLDYSGEDTLYLAFEFTSDWSTQAGDATRLWGLTFDFYSWDWRKDFSEAYALASGTSMATPATAGVAALMLARNGMLTAASLKSTIITTADDKAAFTGKCVSGGRVNAFAALSAVTAAPFADDDGYGTTEDTALTVPVGSGVLVGDTNGGSGTLTAVRTGGNGPSHGSVTLNANGSFTYTPAADYSGVDSFTYRAYNGSQYSNWATVTITIAPVNDAPRANPDSYSVATNGVLTVPNPGVLANDVDPEGEEILVDLEGDALVMPTHGTLNNISSYGTFTYTPSPGYSGIDTFRYRAVAGGDVSAYTTVTITVGSATNHAPVLAAIGNKSVAEGSLLTFTASATDADADSLAFSLDAGAPTGASITSVGVFSWVPTEAQGSGSYPITVRVSDGKGGTDFETITVTVTEVPGDQNVPPQFAPIGDRAAALGSTLTIAVGATDGDGDPLTYSLGAGAPAGAAISTGGVFTWTPSAKGSYPVTITVSDGRGGTASESITITVTEAVTLMPVYRFFRPSTGTHFYTADPAEMVRVRDTLGHLFTFEGVGYTINTANPVNSAPLYRFYNRKTGTHLYTADESEKNTILATLSAIYSLDGVAYNVSMSGGTAVHRFFSPSKGVHFYSSDPTEIAYVRANLGHIWSYEGPAYYVGQ